MIEETLKTLTVKDHYFLKNLERHLMATREFLQTRVESNVVETFDRSMREIQTYVVGELYEEMAEGELLKTKAREFEKSRESSAGH